jgi:hypothetical protein
MIVLLPRRLVEPLGSLLTASAKLLGAAKRVPRSRQSALGQSRATLEGFLSFKEPVWAALTEVSPPSVCVLPPLECFLGRLNGVLRWLEGILLARMRSRAALAAISDELRRVSARLNPVSGELSQLSAPMSWPLAKGRRGLCV